MQVAHDRTGGLSWCRMMRDLTEQTAVISLVLGWLATACGGQTEISVSFGPAVLDVESNQILQLYAQAQTF